jgi:hydroxymethylpyrimidine/phosphomethylpyrimidine kinase
MAMNNRPVVIAFAGSDPTGGAGLAADLQTLSSLGCHPAPVVTAVTAQDTSSVKAVVPTGTDLVIAQARAVLEDMPVAAFKTGLLPNTEIVSAVASICNDYPDIPLVVDPVLAAGSGDPLTDPDVGNALVALLAQRALVFTPNSAEARRLAPQADNLEACAQEIMAAGCQYVLITGTHENTPQVFNRLYSAGRCLETYTCVRLAGEFHGSGCTLAAAITAGIAHGLEPANAVANALDFTLKTLKHAIRPGMGQQLPDRLFWAGRGESAGD